MNWIVALQLVFIFRPHFSALYCQVPLGVPSDCLYRAELCPSFVAELEKRFKKNERQMQKQRTQLDELRENATVVRDEIRKQVHEYSSCV